MWIKIVVVVLLIAMVASLFTGFHFLKVDLGHRKRTLYALGIRIGLAVLLAAVLVYGFYSGQFTMQAPWHGRY